MSDSAMRLKWSRPDAEGIVTAAGLPGVQIEREDADTDHGRRVQYVISTPDAYATCRTLADAKALVQEIVNAVQVSGR